MVTATAEIYTLSLHDALPILVGHVDSSNVQLPSGVGAYYGAPCGGSVADLAVSMLDPNDPGATMTPQPTVKTRSEEHTSELQSQSNLVCRLLLEKKKTTSPKY